MADFDVGAAALEAFRPREKRFVLLGTTIAYALVSFVLLAAYVAINWSFFREIGAWYFGMLHAAMSGSRPNLEAFQPPAGIFALAPTAIALGVLSLIARAAYEAGCLRWLVRGQTGGVLNLSLGGDTWLVFFSYLLWAVLLMCLTIGCACIIGLMYAGLHAIGGVQGMGWLTFLLVILTPFACLAAIGGVLYVAVRLAPAAASSVGAQRFAFFDAWGATKGRFWPMLGAFLVVIVGLIIAQVLIRGVLLGPLSASLMQEVAGADAPSLDHFIAAVSAPTTLAMIGLGAVLYMIAEIVFALATFGINARAVTVPNDEPAAA